MGASCKIVLLLGNEMFTSALVAYLGREALGAFLALGLLRLRRKHLGGGLSKAFFEVGLALHFSTSEGAG